MGRKNKDEYNAYMAEYMLKRYHERMAEAKTILGGICALCGAKDNLDIDHIDPKKKSFTFGSKATSIIRDKFLAELKKCQLLCKSCHIEKNKIDNFRPITHGKYHAAYHLKCECQKCLIFKKEYCEQRRLNRKLASVA